MVTINSTPLIYFAKVEKLGLIFDVLGRVQIPPEVYHETVIVGKSLGYRDAYVIDSYVGKGYIILHELDEEAIKRAKRIALWTRIDFGEAQVIVLALQKNETVVIMDDPRARNVAMMYGLRPRGTLYILYQATRIGKISRKEAHKILDEMIDKNFRISADLYKRFLKKLYSNTNTK